LKLQKTVDVQASMGHYLASRAVAYWSSDEVPQRCREEVKYRGQEFAGQPSRTGQNPTKLIRKASKLRVWRTAIGGTQKPPWIKLGEERSQKHKQNIATGQKMRHKGRS